MVRCKSCLALVVLAAVGVSMFNFRAQAAPEPAAAPLSWELDFKAKIPERLIAAPADKTESQTYWYIRYTVANESGREVLFTPEFQLMTDTGQLITSGKGVDNAIFNKLKELYKNPFLVSPFQILGKILQGQDNAKDGVAIFTGVDADARNFRILVSGLSGETADVENPVTHKTVVLHKTLVLEYQIPGEAIGIDPQPQLKSKQWVMK